MLVLKRKSEETIVINDDVRVKILSVNGGVVKIGIDAPREVTVDREETWFSKQEDKRRRLANGSQSLPTEQE